MDKNKKLIVALPILLVIAVLVWMSGARSPAHKPSKADGATAIESSFPDKKGLATLLNTLSSVKGSDDDDTAWSERDPFDVSVVDKKVVENVADDKQERTTASFHLSGIFWNETKPSAIINDLVVGVGSAVGLAMVKEIMEDKVILNDGKKDVVLMSRSSD